MPAMLAEHDASVRVGFVFSRRSAMPSFDDVQLHAFISLCLRGRRVHFCYRWFQFDFLRLCNTLDIVFFFFM